MIFRHCHWFWKRGINVLRSPNSFHRTPPMCSLLCKPRTFSQGKHDGTGKGDDGYLDETPATPKPDTDVTEKLHTKIAHLKKQLEAMKKLKNPEGREIKKPDTDDDDQKKHREYYPVNTESKYRGKALIIANANYVEPIPGLYPSTHKDGELMENVFKKLRYQVTVLKDKTGSEMWHGIQDFKKSFTAEDDSFIFYYSGHGSRTEINPRHGESPLVYAPDGIEGSNDHDDCIVGINGVLLSVYNSIVRSLNNKYLKIMRGKPKIFIFDCCRGNITENIRGASIGPDAQRTITSFQGSKIPDTVDVILCQATAPNRTASSLAIDLPGVYTQTVSNVLLSNVNDLSLSTCLTMVNKEIAGKHGFQSGNHTTYLTKQVKMTLSQKAQEEFDKKDK